MKLSIKGTDQQKQALYPSVTDQLDAIWKILDGMGASIPEEAKEISDKVKQVKQILTEKKFETAALVEDTNGKTKE